MKLPPPEPAVTALARDVEELRRQLDALRADVDGAQQTADAAHRVLLDLADRVAAIGDAQAVTAPTMAKLAGSKSGAPSWLVIEGQQAAEGLLADLVEWCGSVLRHYPGVTEAMGECWLLHPAAVEELAALRSAWIDAYVGENASAARAMDWHDRHRPGAVARVADVVGTCTAADHRPGRAEGLFPRPVAGADKTVAVAAWWCTTRGSIAPPWLTVEVS